MRRVVTAAIVAGTLIVPAQAQAAPLCAKPTNRPQVNTCLARALPVWERKVLRSSTIRGRMRSQRARCRANTTTQANRFPCSAHTLLRNGEIIYSVGHVWRRSGTATITGQYISGRAVSAA